MTAAHQRWSPGVELRTRTRVGPREHVVEVETPGIDADDLRVELRGHVVSIHAGEAARSFRLPDGVDTRGLSATHCNGVLRLSAPCARLTTRVIPVDDEARCVHADAPPI